MFLLSWNSSSGLVAQGYFILKVFFILPFFRENKWDFEKTSPPEIKGWRIKVNYFSTHLKELGFLTSPLQTKDGRLCIFACDYFNLTPDLVGSVDAVYDRGALGAINLQDRQAYVKLMQKLLGKEFR